MEFTAGEITGLITAIVLVGGFILQIRSTSFSQWVKMNEVLTTRVAALELSNERKAEKIEALERQVDNYERWMTSALAEIQRLGGTPPPWNSKL